MAWTIDGSSQGEYTGAIILRPGRSTDRAGAETQVKLIRNPKSEDSSEIRNPKSEGRRRRYPEQNPEVAGRHSIESRSRGGGTRIQNPDTLPGEHALCLLLQQLLNLQRLRGTDHPRHLLESSVFICSPQPPLATVVALHFSEWFQNLR